MTDISFDHTAAPPPPLDPPSITSLSLVERVESLERIVQGIRDMMARDRQFMADLQEKIGL